MKSMNKKGQAEIMDGLILMLIASTCSILLLSISSNYGVLPVEIYEENFAKKLAQNTLLGLYHVTYLDKPDSSMYRKSIMVGVAQQLSNGHTDIRGTEVGDKIQEILDGYHRELGWNFLFSLTKGGTSMIPSSIISTSDPHILSQKDYYAYVGAPYCATSALTFPKGSSGCGESEDAEAGDMCYIIFGICVWQT